MLENFGFFIGMVLMISVIVMVSDKIKIAYPILLVLAGLGISFIPSAPKVNINPHLIFMIFFTSTFVRSSDSGKFLERNLEMETNDRKFCFFDCIFNFHFNSFY